MRGVAFRATSGLRLVQLAMKSAPSSPGRTELLEQDATTLTELPLLVELELLPPRSCPAGRCCHVGCAASWRGC